MTHQSSKIIKPASFDEYGVLKSVIMCEPIYLNTPSKHQKKTLGNTIDTKKAVKQHREFAKALNAFGIEVVLLTPDPYHPEQVYTRDIGLLWIMPFT